MEIPDSPANGWRLDEGKLGRWDWNREKGEFYFSPRCRNLIGLEAGEPATRERFVAAIHPDDRDRAWRAMTKAPGSEEPDHVEFRCLLPDGAVRWMTSIGCGLEDQSAGGILLDTTAWKEAEQSAVEGVERFRFLAEFLPEKVFTTKPNGDLEYLNQQWSIYTGLPIEKILELGWRDFVHPEDIGEKARRWTQAVKNGTPFEFEHRFRREDGVYRWHLSRARPMRRKDGSIIMWVGANTDVDDLKRAQFELHESESRSRLAMEAAGLGFWDWHLAGNIKWSPEHNRMLGLDPAKSEGTYEEGIRQIHPDDIPQVEEALARAQKERLDFEAEFRVVPPEGGPLRWIAAHGRAYYEEESGRPVRMIGVVRDVTQRRTFEEQLRWNQEELRAALTAAEHAREQAEAASRAKDQFLAVLSHELRTPLTPVLMGVSSLKMEKTLPAGVCEVLEMIERNIKVEARLIEDLLDLTRITRNKVELRRQPMDVHLAVRQALEICRSDFEAKKQRLTVELEAVPSTIDGDFERLQQVFWNLLKNAVKFTPERGQISVCSSYRNGRVGVEISDSGVGIATEALVRIFSPFEQGDQSHARRFGGLGLGLAISKATVEAHAGSISARSAGINLGATFLVELATVPF
ncbi:hypothetical protein BH09VER1_BH09VER1_35120 [soil metagenome]